jgi:hypothetical protein
VERTGETGALGDEEGVLERQDEFEEEFVVNGDEL